MQYPPPTEVLSETLSAISASLEAQLRCVRKIESDLEAFQRAQRPSLARANKQAAILDELRDVRQMQQTARHALDVAFQATRDILAE